MTHPLLAPFPVETTVQVKAALLRLTSAELEVAREMMLGKEAVVAAARLGIAPRTFEVHVRAILRLCQCSRFEFMRAVLELANDPEVAAYLSSLPPKRGNGRLRNASTGAVGE